jgi:hypothetical protein
MEAGDASVALDLFVRSLIALGSTRRDLTRVIGCGEKDSHAIKPYDTSSGCSPERQTLKPLTVLWFLSL